MPFRTLVLGGLATMALCLPTAAWAQDSVKNAQVCAWIVETNEPESVHHFDLWLQSNGEVSFLYVIAGEGVVSQSGKSHSPSSGSFVLHAGKAEKPWSFGTTVGAPAKLDIIVELRQTPADIFSKDETPLLAKYTFRRDIPESEKSAPAVLAKKQCSALKI